MRKLLPSCLTDAEKLRLSFHPFQPCDAPIGYADVSRSQLSLARHSGAATINGHRYTYCADSDELWRDDVLALVHEWRKEPAAQKPAGPQWDQLPLLGGE